MHDGHLARCACEAVAHSSPAVLSVAHETALGSAAIEHLVQELLKEAQAGIAAREAAAAARRRAWNEWNPQREAQRRLCEQVASGEISAEELQRRHTGCLPQASLQPGTIPACAARERGWYPHPDKFSWPSVKSPAVRGSSVSGIGGAAEGSHAEGVSMAALCAVHATIARAGWALSALLRLGVRLWPQA